MNHWQAKDITSSLLTKKNIYCGAEGYYDYTLYFSKYGSEIENKKKNAYIK